MQTLIIEGVRYSWCAATMDVKRASDDMLMGMAQTYDEARKVVFKATGLNVGRPWLNADNQAVVR